MSKIYRMPFDWDYVDDNTLIYVDTSADGIKAMVDSALDEALDDVKAEVVDETISTMDIKLEGENLLYRLLVKGDDKGEINIPKDQFLKSASYDKDNKKLIFVMETTDGEKTTEVSINELVEAIEEKNNEQDITLDEKADKTEVNSALETINAKDEAQDTEIAAKAVKADVDAALETKADKTELEPLAKSADVTAEIAAAVEPLATKEEVNAVDAKFADYATTEALNQEVERATAKENEIEEALNVEAQRATNAESELQGKDAELQANIDQVDAKFADKADKTELEPLATKEEVANVDAKFADYATADALAQVEEKKVDWVESTPDRKHIVLKNHDSILGTATDGGTYNVAMVSKWDVADFGSASLHLNLNSKDGIATINDDENIATESFVGDSVANAVDGLAKAADVTAEIAAAVEPLAVKADVDAALELKADKTELEPLAVKEEVTAEIASAVEPLATKEEVANKVDWVESTPDRKHIVLKNHDSVLGTATDGTTYNVAMVSKWDVADFGSAQLHLNLNSKDGVATINDDKVIATEGFVADSIASAIEPLALKTDVESAAAGAVAQVVANAPEDFNTLKEVADYIAADKTKATEIETKLSEHDAALEAKADKTELEPLAKAADVTAEIAAAVEPLAVKANVDTALEAKADKTELEPLAVKAEVTEEINAVSSALADYEAQADAAIATKANAEDVYTKTESDEMFQASGDYVPVEDYNALVQKVAALENYVNIFIKDREEKMDEIINNMDADNKEVVIETPMESIVVPETTVAYTITAPLADNSTVELTSPKYMTLFNTSEEPVSTSIGHTFVEGESTSATSVYLVGDFDTLTLENVSPAVKSGYDAASVNNVVITENNVKNLTLALDIQDGATITNNSNANITIQDKNDLATTLTIVAPNSTVTLNGSNYEVVNATVSDNTLVIKKNVGHIGTLNVSKGNVIVEVARQSLIADKIGEYTLADGYTIDYLHDEIDSTNIANLTKEGTHVLVEDIEKSGNFSVGVLSSDELIWDLNGHSITSSNTRGYGIFTLRGSAKLEINDTVGTGVVKNTADEYGFWTSTVGSKVVINGGHFEASTHVLYAQKGTIEVNGGSFRLTNEDTADKDEFGNFKFLVNCHDEDYVSGDAKIIIRGGKFYGWNPSASYGEPGGPVSFVAEGYGVVESTEMIDGVEHKVFEVKPINE